TMLDIDPDDPRGRARLVRMVSRAKAAGHARDLTETQIFERLLRGSAIARKQLVCSTVSHGIDEGMEIFDSLNSRGIRFRWIVVRTMRESIGAALGGWAQMKKLTSPDRDDFAPVSHGPNRG